MKKYLLFQTKTPDGNYHRAVLDGQSKELLEAIDFQGVGRIFDKRGIQVTRNQLEVPREIKVPDRECFPTDEKAKDRFMLGCKFSDE